MLGGSNFIAPRDTSHLGGDYIQICVKWFNERFDRVFVSREEIKFQEESDDVVRCRYIVASHLSHCYHISYLLAIENASSTYYPTERRVRRAFSRASSRAEWICAFALPETNVIRKFPITCRRQNFPGEQNSFLAISSWLGFVSVAFRSP